MIDALVCAVVLGAVAPLLLVVLSSPESALGPVPYVTVGGLGTLVLAASVRR